MKIEKIRKSHKKEIFIGAIAVCVVGSIFTFATSKAKYKLTQDIPLVRGTVNYKVSDMRTVALYTANDSGDYIEANEIPTNGYELNQEKSTCKVYDGTTTIENAPKDNNATIEYKNGAVTFANITKKNTRCYLYFDKYVPKASDILLANVTPKDTTPNFSQAATTNEGVFKAEDGMYGGISYYWRGAVENNYIKFANFCWRIIRINGDGSIRLIYDGAICHKSGTSTKDSIVNSVAYYATNNQSNCVGWSYEGNLQRPTNNKSATPSNAKVQLENWYNNLKSYESKIADGKYCNDRNVGKFSNGTQGTYSATGDPFAYAGYYRLIYSYQPTLSCTDGDVYSLKAGLITADEAMYAGGKSVNNNQYYLYNGQNYWMMTPWGWGTTANLFYIDNEGKMSGTNGTGSLGLRPVINLHSDVTFSDGDGTLENPYIVKSE